MHISPSGDFPKVAADNPVLKPANSEVKNEKLQRLHDAIANGTYKVNVASLAQKIVDAGVLNEK